MARQHRIGILALVLVTSLIVAAPLGAYASQAKSQGSHRTYAPVVGASQPRSSSIQLPLGQLVITAADNGRTVTLTTNQVFVVALGKNLNWDVTIADPSIVRPLVPLRQIQILGIQGIYQAVQPGRTELTAMGAPICRPGQLCPMFRVLVRVNLVVR